MIKILDCTIRDGGHQTDWRFDEKFVLDLMNELNQKNVTYFEIGYRNHYNNENKGEFYNCDVQLLQKFYPFKGNLKLGVMTDISRFSKDDFPSVSGDLAEFVRIACHPDEITKTFSAAKELKNRGYCVFLQLMEVQNIDIDGYIALLEWRDKSVIDSLYFADSCGTVTPEQIPQYMNKFKMLGYKNISFHGHNKNSKVLENTLAAINSGAFSVDTTKNGIGRNGGNLSLDDLLNNL